MIVKVRIIPKSPENEVVSRIGSVLRVKIVSPSMDEEANGDLRDFLADFFDVSSGHVNIIRGAKGREKTIEIGGKSEEDLKKVMDSIP